jgi:hypothetical protein
MPYDSRIAQTNGLPEVVRLAFARGDDPQTPEQDLFLAFCERVVLDALGITGLPSSTQHEATVGDARRFLRFSKYSQDWFDLAGVEFDPVRRAVLAVEPGSLDTGGRAC